MPVIISIGRRWGIGLGVFLTAENTLNVNLPATGLNILHYDVVVRV